MLKKLAAISLTAGALVLAVPATASAAPGDSYAEPPSVLVDTPVVDVCGESTVVFEPGYFQPGETVSVGVSGAKAADASYSGNVASAEGAMELSFSPPADGEGNYSIAFSGTRSYTAVITVARAHDAAAGCDQDPAAAPAGSEVPQTGELALAVTGGGVSPSVIGGSLVALAAGGLLVAAGVARRRRS